MHQPVAASAVSANTFLEFRVCGTYIFLQEAVEFLFAILHAHTVARVDHPYQRVGLLEVIAPVRSERALPTDVP